MCLGSTIKFLRRTTSGTAGNGLGTAINYLRGAAGIGLGTMIKYVQFQRGCSNCEPTRSSADAAAPGRGLSSSVL
jgi:hypothetical protein